MKYQAVLKRFKATRIFLWSFLIALVLFFSMPVTAGGSSGNEKKTGELYQQENNQINTETPKEMDDKEWEQKLSEIINFIEGRKEELFPIKFLVGIAFNGDKAADNSLFKLNIKSEFKGYQYPGEFGFKAGTSLQLKNGDLQEDVTTLVINYNHYFEPWLEMYGFVERFSDSFLSIRHRYEIGGGILFEFNLWDKKREKKREKEFYLSFLKNFFNDNNIPLKGKQDEVKAETLREFIEKKPSSFYGAKKKADEIVKKEKCYYGFIGRKFTHVSASLAFTILSELEKAEIETYIDEKITGEDGTTTIREGTATTKFPLEGEQRFRMTFRPRVIINLGDNLTITGHIYFKYPLGRPKKIFGRTDYRLDASLKAELNVSSPFSWAKNLALSLEYQRHYDNLPPRLPESIISEYFQTGKIIRKTIADGTHEEFYFGLNIYF